MLTVSAMGAVYTSSPPHVARASASPEATQMDHELVADINAMQNHDGDCQRGYVPSHWSGCLGAPTASDEYDNYALHRSPVVNSLQHASSAESSPRSWDSPEQLGPTPWEAATEQVHTRYHALDPQLSGYLQSASIPTSFPADAVPFLPSQTLSGSDDSYQRARSQTEPCPAGYHSSPRDGYASTPESGLPLSPCSTTLTLSMDDTVPSSPGDDDNCKLVILKTDNQQKTSASLGDTLVEGSSKNEEPYAQLIYRAFLSTPRRAMTLQEIYQWFRENTDKGRDESKGWQNSIRHNLSMNMAFTKRERKLSTAKDGETETASTSSTTPTDSKKSTEWYLEPWAITGVQSTTRYRKGNQSRRSTASHGLTARAYRSYPAHHHHSFSSGSLTSSSSTSTSNKKPARLPRGRSAGGAALRSAAATHAAAAAAAHHHFQQHQQHHQQHYFSPASAAAAARSPFINHLINDPASSGTPTPHPHYAPPPHATMSSSSPYSPFFHANHHHHHHAQPGLDSTNTNTNTGNTGGGMEYDYPDPQLFPGSSSSLGRAPSDAGIDEPTTPPEALHSSSALHHHHHPMYAAAAAAATSAAAAVPVPVPVPVPVVDEGAQYAAGYHPAGYTMVVPNMYQEDHVVQDVDVVVGGEGSGGGGGGVYQGWGVVQVTMGGCEGEGFGQGQGY